MQRPGLTKLLPLLRRYKAGTGSFILSLKNTVVNAGRYSLISVWLLVKVWSFTPCIDDMACVGGMVR